MLFFERGRGGGGGGSRLSLIFFYLFAVQHTEAGLATRFSGQQPTISNSNSNTPYAEWELTTTITTIATITTMTTLRGESPRFLFSIHKRPVDPGSSVGTS